jgi:dienelactone hydrolase
MRLFEILLLLASIPYFLWPVVSKTRRPQWVAAFPALGLVFLLLHLLVEGYRWQMIPAYILTTILFLLTFREWLKKPEETIPSINQKRWLAIIMGLAGLLLVAISAVLPILMPIPQLIEPGGHYEVGTVTYYWVDTERQETFGPDPGSPRELMVQIWYPAEENQRSETALWHPQIETAGPAIANWLDLPSFLLNHLIYSRTNSHPDLPLAGSQNQYKVILFSHGLGGLRVQNTYQMEELASQGYVVAAVDHTYGAVITVFPDGRIALFDNATIEGDSDAKGNVLMHIWLADSLFVLDQLAILNEADLDGRFTNRLNLDTIGYVGQSTGGGTAYLFCQTDPRCGAGVALDGWLAPLSEEIADQPMEQPFLFLKAEDWSTPENSAAIQAAHENRQTPGDIITLPGTRHYNFTDLPQLSPLTPQLGLAGPANGPETLAVINDYTLSFFNDHLKN